MSFRRYITQANTEMLSIHQTARMNAIILKGASVKIRDRDSEHITVIPDYQEAFVVPKEAVTLVKESDLNSDDTFLNSL